MRQLLLAIAAGARVLIEVLIEVVRIDMEEMGASAGRPRDGGTCA